MKKKLMIVVLLVIMLILGLYIKRTNDKYNAVVNDMIIFKEII